MSLIIPNNSKITILNLITNNISSGGDLKLKLFINDIIPSNATVIEDITECSYSGYSPINLTGSNWLTDTTDGTTVTSYEQQTFSLLEGGLVYGYFITSNSGSDLFWIERFSGAPFEVPNGGGTINISLSIGLN